MSLEVKLKLSDTVAEITLAGELDASTAPLFQAELGHAAAAKPRYLGLQLGELEYMASAGVRLLLVTRERMAPEVEIRVVAPREEIPDTLRRTGVYSAIIVSADEPAENGDRPVRGMTAGAP